MVLTTKSIVNANTALGTPTSITGLSETIFTQTQKGTTPVGILTGTTTTASTATPSSKSISSLATNVLGVATKVGTAKVAQLLTSTNVSKTTQKAVGIASATLKVASSLSGKSALQSTLTGISGSLSTNVTQLANSLNSTLSGIFNNTNVASASNVGTVISDPIKVNLLSTDKAPNASPFKVSSLEAGSQIITQSGSSSLFGSEAQSMIGSMSTEVLKDRFDLSSFTGVSTGIVTSASTLSSSSLFSTAATSVTGKSSTTSTDTLTSALTTMVSGALTGKSLGEITASTVKSLSNDASRFLGKTSELSSLTGITVGDYFTTTGKSSILDQDGNLVTTNSGGVDSDTANAILNLVKEVGCNPSAAYYNSQTFNDSMFNLALAQAAAYGMDDLVNDLLGCSSATTTQGQSTLSSVVASIFGTDVNTSSTIVSSISNTSALNTKTNTTAIVTNTNLKQSDTATVSALLAALGSSYDSAYSVESLDDIVYDSSILGSTQKTFLDSCFGDTSMSTYLGGSDLTFTSAGTFTLV